ncbi:hypothetical protein Ocin01_14593, partial [Orchesella cincta]
DTFETACLLSTDIKTLASLKMKAETRLECYRAEKILLRKQLQQKSSDSSFSSLNSPIYDLKSTSVPFKPLHAHSASRSSVSTSPPPILKPLETVNNAYTPHNHTNLTSTQAPVGANFTLPHATVSPSLSTLNASFLSPHTTISRPVFPTKAPSFYKPQSIVPLSATNSQTIPSSLQSIFPSSPSNSSSKQAFPISLHASFSSTESPNFILPYSSPSFPPKKKVDQSSFKTKSFIEPSASPPQPSTTPDEETSQPSTSPDEETSQPSTTSDEETSQSSATPDEETSQPSPPQMRKQVNRPPPKKQSGVHHPDEETSQPSAIPYAETSQPSTTPDEETSQPSTTPVEESGKSSSSNTVKYTIPPVLTQNASRDATASSSTTAKCPTVVYLPILPRIHNNTEATTSNTLSWVVNSKMLFENVNINFSCDNTSQESDEEAYLRTQCNILSVGRKLKGKVDKKTAAILELNPAKNYKIACKSLSYKKKNCFNGTKSNMMIADWPDVIGTNSKLFFKVKREPLHVKLARLFCQSAVYANMIQNKIVNINDLTFMLLLPSWQNAYKCQITFFRDYYCY